jgi:hypothetical protein
MVDTTDTAGCPGWIDDLGSVKDAVEVSYIRGYRSIIGIEIRFDRNIIPREVLDDHSLYIRLKDIAEMKESFTEVVSSAYELTRGQMSIHLGVGVGRGAEDVANAVVEYLNELVWSAERGDVLRLKILHYYTSLISMSQIRFAKEVADDMTNTTEAVDCQGWSADLGRVKNGIKVSLMAGHHSIIGIEFRFNPNILPKQIFDEDRFAGGGLYSNLQEIVEHGHFAGFPTVVSSLSALERGQMSIHLGVEQRSDAEDVANTVVDCLNKVRQGAEEGRIHVL